jgi:biotin carboxyl carrier protein
MRNNFKTSSEPENIWNKIGYWRIMMQPELEMEGKLFQCKISDYTGNELTAEFEDKKVKIRFEETVTSQQIEIQLNGEPFTAFVSHPEPGRVIVSYNTHTFEVIRKDILSAQPEFNIITASVGESGSNITSPMPGRVIKIVVKEGDEVSKGDILLVVEAMKMENNILSPADAIVDRINVEAGDLVDSNAILVHLSMPQ